MYVNIAIGAAVEPEVGIITHSNCVPEVGVVIGNTSPSQTIVGVEAVPPVADVAMDLGHGARVAAEGGGIGGADTLLAAQGVAHVAPEGDEGEHHQQVALCVNLA